MRVPPAVSRWVRFAAVLALLTSSLSPPLIAHAAPGDLDPMFGSGGIVQTPFPARAEPAAIGVTNDGKAVVAGTIGPSFGLARSPENGSPDPAIGAGGIVTTTI